MSGAPVPFGAVRRALTWPPFAFTMSDTPFSRRFTTPPPDLRDPRADGHASDWTRRITIPQTSLAHQRSWWGRVLVTRLQFPEIPAHIDATVVGTPEGMLVRGTCCCGARWERLIDERPFLAPSLLDVGLQLSMRALTQAVAALQDNWACAHADCDAVLAAWHDDAAGGTIIPGAAESLCDPALHDVPPSMRFLAVMPPALVAAAQHAATAHVHALACGERRPEAMALVLTPVGAAPHDGPGVAVETVALTLDQPPGALPGQFSPGAHGAAEMMACCQHVLREHARANPARVIGAYAVTAGEPHRAGSGHHPGGRLGRRAARRREQRARQTSAASRDQLHPRRGNGQSSIRLDIVTPTCGGRFEVRSVPLGRGDVDVVFAVNADVAARATHLDGVLASPYDTPEA